MSLDLRQAVAAAREHFQFLVPEFAKPGDVRLEDVRLEEIERDGENWVVTLSVPFREKSGLGNYLAELDSSYGIGFQRLAKVVVVDGSNGNLVALKQSAA